VYLLKKALTLLLLVILMASSAYAAQWVGPLTLKQSWDRKESGFCPGPGMCLVTASPDANEDWNGMPNKYFSDPPGPKCIDDGQYILDYFCEDGQWTTRTKLLGLSLLDFAQTKSNNYVLFCDDYKNALNQYQYIVGSGGNTKLVEDLFKDYRCEQPNSTTRTTCTNHFCVLKYRGGTAVATSLNTGVDDEDYSFLFALNDSEDACDNVQSSSDITNWQQCTGWAKTGRVYYNPALNAIIHFSTSDAPTSSDYSAIFASFVEPEFDDINAYVKNNVADPDVSALNFSFFKDTGLYNHWYYSRQLNKYVFGFLEKDRTEFGYDYLGMKYSGYAFGSGACDYMFKQYGTNNKGRGVFCDSQSGSDFFVVAKGARNSESPLIDAWQDLDSKLRPK
jgi:opacity protein-like surface antigen